MQTSSLISKFLSISIFLVVGANLAAAQPASRLLDRAVGTYQSQIWSEGAVLSGTTAFRQTKDGTLNGRYTMKEQDRLVPGTLSQCREARERVLRCIWNDQYGSGTLEVTFSENFSSFTGLWSGENSKPTYQWDGSRQ